jgi:hypothetical protein
MGLEREEMISATKAIETEGILMTAIKLSTGEERAFATLARTAEGKLLTSVKKFSAIVGVESGGGPTYNMVQSPTDPERREDPGADDDIIDRAIVDINNDVIRIYFLEKSLLVASLGVLTAAIGIGVGLDVIGRLTTSGSGDGTGEEQPYPLQPSESAGPGGPEPTRSQTPSPTPRESPTPSAKPKETPSISAGIPLDPKSMKDLIDKLLDSIGVGLGAYTAANLPLIGAIGIGLILGIYLVSRYT